jgi:hypothetical protein
VLAGSPIAAVKVDNGGLNMWTWNRSIKLTRIRQADSAPNASGLAYNDSDDPYEEFEPNVKEEGNDQG